LKLTSLQTTAYRVLIPKWSHAPTSGAGAALHGGRVNRPGIEALYLSLDTDTAIHEYQQTSSLLPPGTLVAYQIDLNPIVDFSAGFDAGVWPALWEDFFCDWRECWFNRHVEPPSWVIGDEIIAAGAKGILFPSVARSGGFNLTVYSASLSTSDVIAVHDPGRLLPQDQSSWT
jgi:RES domain-containing protein